MRWLTVAVAGSFCPGGVWLGVLLLLTGGIGQAQMVALADRNGPYVSIESPGFTLVEVVTDRNATEFPLENAQCPTPNVQRPITDRGGVAAEYSVSFALVDIVT